MASWINPVYDRTQSDVDYAKGQIRRFKANGGITDGINLKGCLNDSDINRIENNSRYLCDELVRLYYFCDIPTTHTWSIWSVPNNQQIDRIINNIKKLQSAYYTPENSPELPKTISHYEDANFIEKCLYLLKEMIDDMVSRFRECGDGLECGED